MIFHSANHGRHHIAWSGDRLLHGRESFSGFSAGAYSLTQKLMDKQFVLSVDTANTAARALELLLDLEQDGWLTADRGCRGALDELRDQGVEYA